MKTIITFFLSLIISLISIGQNPNDPATYADCNSFTDTVNICRNSLVDFEEFSYSNNLEPYEWYWWFQGASPDTSREQNPDSIRYDNPGLFYVKCSTMYYNKAFLNFRTSSVKCMMIRVLKHNTFDNIPISDTSICDGDEIVLDATYNQFNDNDTIEPLNINYLWTSSTASIEEIFVTTPTLKVNKPGKYKVRVFTSCGSNEKEIIVKQKDCTPKILIPTAFTPNNDGLNDTYKVMVESYYKFNITIYSRWGECVYASNNPNMSWDGNYRNKEVPSGVYLVVVHVKTNNITKTFTKSISLLR